MGLGFTIGKLCVLILGHATCSTIQYRGGFLWAASKLPGKFMSIRTDSENRTVALPEKSEFMIFNHRGRAFPAQLDLKLKH